MQQFALLLDCLTTTPSRNGKLALLVEYFRDAPDPDRGFALAALTDGLFPRLPLRRALGELMADKIDPVLYQLSRDYVGDTAETVSLLWPDRRDTRPLPAPRRGGRGARARARATTWRRSSATSSTGSTCAGAGRS